MVKRTDMSRSESVPNAKRKRSRVTKRKRLIRDDSAKDSEQRIKEQLVEITNVVRQKYKDLMRNADSMERLYEASAKSLIAPLQKTLVESVQKAAAVNIKQESSIKKEEEEEANEDNGKHPVDMLDTSTQTESLAEQYLRNLSKSKYRIHMDQTYGVRADGSGGAVIGDSKIVFSKNNYIYVQSKKYRSTPGLLELLFMAVPNKELVQVDDLNAYKEILIMTNAHKQTYSSDMPINRNKSKKYTTTISVLFPAHTDSVGSGMSQDYTGNVNLLVNRLRILILSQQAGHTGHREEIASIVNLLREYGVIV